MHIANPDKAQHLQQLPSSTPSALPQHTHSIDSVLDFPIKNTNCMRKRLSKEET
jgi:hypothetical protein